MNSHLQDIELIERFFRQELNDDELLAFENRVRQDPEFSKEVIQMRNIFYSVKMAARKDLKEELQEIKNAALSEGTKPYKPNGIKWLKWFTSLVITAAIVGVGYNYLDHNTIAIIKSKLFIRDTTENIENATPPPGSETPTIIKDPSDSTYKYTEADIRLQVKDPSTFSIKKIGVSENGLYNYEIKADGNTQIVSSPNPNLTTELLRRKNATVADTIPKANIERNKVEKPDVIEEVDF